MTQWDTLRIDDFTGGLNDNADSFHLQPNELMDCFNVNIDRMGGISMRKGLSLLANNSTYSSSQGGVGENLVAWTDLGTRQLLVAVRDRGSLANTQRILYINSGSSTLTDTGITMNSDNDRLRDCIWAVWDGDYTKVYITRAAAAQAQRWDGSSAATLSTSGAGQWQDDITDPSGGSHQPWARHVAVHADRMWVAHTYEDTVSYGNRVRFSHPGFPEAWRQLDYIDIVGGSGGITAIFPQGDRLLVFKTDSVHAIYGYDTDTFSVVKLADNVGALCGRHVAYDGIGAYYFYSIQRKAILRITSEGIGEISGRVSESLDGNFSADNIAVSWASNRLWVGIIESGNSDNGDFEAGPTLVFDPRVGAEGAWVRHGYNTNSSSPDYRGVWCIVDFDESNVLGCLQANPEFAVFRFDYATVFQDYDASTATLTTYDSYFRTPWFDLGEVSRKKMWGRCDFIVDTTNAETALTIGAYRDWNTETVNRTSTLTIPDDAGFSYSDNNQQLIRSARLGLGRAVQLKVTGPGALAWNVESITFKYKPRTIR